MFPQDPSLYLSFSAAGDTNGRHITGFPVPKGPKDTCSGRSASSDIIRYEQKPTGRGDNWRESGKQMWPCEYLSRCSFVGIFPEVTMRVLSRGSTCSRTGPLLQ